MEEKALELIEVLKNESDWVSSQVLASTLGVTSRTVRNYISSAKVWAEPFEILLTSPRGYKLDFEMFSAFKNAQSKNPRKTQSTSRERAASIIRMIIESPNGATLEEAAKELHVSAATAELDLKKARTIAAEFAVTISRYGGFLALNGTESAIRKLISLLVYSTLDNSFVNLYAVATRFEIPKLIDFKTDLIGRLDFQGFIVNEYDIDSVLLHIAITVNRVRSGRTLPQEPQELAEETESIVTVIRDLVERHFELSLGPVEETYLARQIAARVISTSKKTAGSDTQAKPEDRATLLSILDEVYREYQIDLRDEDLVDRLALHLAHLVYRSKFNVFSRNPIAKLIKTSYPLFFDLAVYICSLLQKERQVVVDEDEISYVALHIGSFLERQAQEANRVTATVICPSYYDLHIVMRESLEKDLGEDISIESVITRTDFNLDDIHSDLIISTIPISGEMTRVIEVKPFLTHHNMRDLRNAVAEIREFRGGIRTRELLLSCFRKELFHRNLDFQSPEEMIIGLGGPLISLGIVKKDYVEGAIERERISSTVFVEGLAVPHAMTMSAAIPAISIAINDEALIWGDQKVNIVALVAFASSGREEFQPVLEKFVEIFSDRTRMLKIIAGANDYESFMETLTAMMDRHY
ncbi:MAG: hypothetical protein RLY22_128 [Actinomycetota bacterium]|jgi:lichenan operon transcriptional antiterminator